MSVVPPQKRSVADNSSQQNLLSKSPDTNITGTKHLSPELYVPEDKYLPPTLHRFPHDIFPNDESLTHHNMLQGVEKTAKNIHVDLKNCSSGVSCTKGNQGKESTTDQEDSQRKGTKEASVSDSLESFNNKNMGFKLNHTNPHGGREIYTDTQDDGYPGYKLSLNGFDRNIEYDAQNISTLINTTTLAVDGNGEALKTIDLNTGLHPEHFEAQNMHNSKRDTHSMSFVDYVPENLATERMKENKHQPCRCIQKLKKYVHDASSMAAEYLVKTACNVFENL